jgi:hypothetical protein
MPATLTALLGVAIHGAQRAEADPTELLRAASMLVTASGARRLAWALEGDELLLNGMPLSGDSPGASLLAEVMSCHGIRQLGLPAGMTATQWSDLAGILASAPGIYPTAAHVEAAVLGVVPGSEVIPTAAGVIDEDEDVEGAGHDNPGSLRFSEGMSNPDPALVSTTADRADFSDLLDPLLDEGSEAVAGGDYPRLAKTLLGLHAIADRGGPAIQAIVWRELRRVVPLAVIETMVNELPSAGGGSSVAEALTLLGRESAAAIVEVLARNPSRGDHRIYIDVLGRTENAVDVVVKMLTSANPALVRDAAELIGRMGAASAVPTLIALLRHSDADIRTTAWHALETIGTPEAIAALGKRR